MEHGIVPRLDGSNDQGCVHAPYPPGQDQGLRRMKDLEVARSSHHMHEKVLAIPRSYFPSVLA